tara:strand:- start:837 stop:1040 length:204 start_codon:yes stop_codon:yes gene_type:complete
MQLTTEESERAAYTANDQPLAIAWGRIIDLENQACELRALVREAVDFIASAEHSDRILETLDKMDDE